ATIELECVLIGIPVAKCIAGDGACNQWQWTSCLLEGFRNEAGFAARRPDSIDLLWRGGKRLKYCGFCCCAGPFTAHLAGNLEGAGFFGSLFKSSIFLLDKRMARNALNLKDGAA